MPEGRFRLDFAPAALRELRRLPAGDAARLRGPILALALEPRPPGATKLTGSTWWRIRVGDLRVIHVVDDTERVVIMVRVARRNERTYRR